MSIIGTKEKEKEKKSRKQEENCMHRVTPNYWLSALAIGN
jgi:hypothetical protein